MMAPRQAPDPRAMPATGPADAVPAEYNAGGQIADLQAEIERRMRADLRLPSPDTGADRVEATIQRLSVAGGYLALGAGYVAAAAAWFYLA